MYYLKKKKYSLGIVTNSPTKIANLELNAYDLGKYFAFILGLGENQEICKPEPDGILLAMKTMKMQPKETLFVGDSTADLVAAKRAHIRAVLLDRTGVKNISHPDLNEGDFIRIKNLTELMVFLESK